MTCWALLGEADGRTAGEGSGEEQKSWGMKKEGKKEQDEMVDEHEKVIKMELGSDQNSSHLSDRDQA